jgi:shikimate kinase / 3-dehydroquinate synthase
MKMENIYIVGFMASGKSTVGRAIAKMTNRTFVDLDHMIEKETNMKIPDIFSEFGEKHFRDIENKVLRDCASSDNLIIATGGGIVENPQNMAFMKSNGTVVYLKASLEILSARLSPMGKSKRPLWQDKESLEARYNSRVPEYEKADIIEEVAFKKSHVYAGRVFQKLFPDQSFTVLQGGVDVPVSAVYDVHTKISEEIGNRKAFVLIDEKVYQHHIGHLPGNEDNCIVMQVEGGEAIKTLNFAEKVYSELIENHFNRDDYLIAIGGGTVTDLGAMVAATFKRGMKFILVSTTLLGSVDAAVGGKSAVNLGDTKNIIGCFTIPDSVLLDYRSFVTLGEQEISDGLIEAYKTGLIKDSDFADYIAKHYQSCFAKDTIVLKYIATRSAELKGEVVSVDFKESGLRAILNFGHTYGHAVEGWHKYKVSHGAAVALGMAVAVKISVNRGLISGDIEEKLISTIKQMSLVWPTHPPFEDALRIMKNDKKIRDDKLVFVLLEGLGKPVIIDDLSMEELKSAIQGV